MDEGSPPFDSGSSPPTIEIKAKGSEIGDQDSNPSQEPLPLFLENLYDFDTDSNHPENQHQCPGAQPDPTD